MKKILIVNAYYYPGFRSGGPQQSVMNLIDVFGNQADFSVLTHNYDYGDPTPYENVVADDWQKVGKANVYYHSQRHFSRKFLQTIAQSFDVVYICEPYHDYAYKLLWLKKQGRIRAEMVLAPMGAFSKGALSQKKLKKQLFWTVMKHLNLFSDIRWSFTSERERQEAIAVVGERNINHYIIAEDLPRPFVDYSGNGRAPKQTGQLKVIFLSRICKQKNLLHAIRLLKSLEGNITFDIYGTLEDTHYWQQCLAQLDSLPAHIQWSYCGEVAPHQVMDTFAQYDVFCFPTLGENYGHVIYESLVAGCIPIISDQTPWHDLEANGAGHIIPLNEEAQYTQTIQRYANMDEMGIESARIATMGYSRTKYLQALENSEYKTLT